MADKAEYLLHAEKTAGHLLTEQLLDEVKRSIRPWELMSEDDQLAVIDRIKRIAEAAVTNMVTKIAAGGAQTVVASVASVTYKKRVKAVLEIGRGPAASALAERAASDIMLVLMDPKEHLDGMDKVRPDKGQIDLLAGGEDPSDEETSE